VQKPRRRGAKRDVLWWECRLFHPVAVGERDHGYQWGCSHVTAIGEKERFKREGDCSTHTSSIELNPKMSGRGT